MAFGKTKKQKPKKSKVGTKMNADYQLVKLKSSDGEVYEVPRIFTKHSHYISNIIQAIPANNGKVEVIPLNVDGKILKKILEWADYHKDDPLFVKNDYDERESNDIIDWDRTYFEVDQKTLYDIMTSAHFLDMPALVDTSCKTVANMIKGKSTEEIRKTFNIECDNPPTDDEVEQLLLENGWTELLEEEGKLPSTSKGTSSRWVTERLC